MKKSLDEIHIFKGLEPLRVRALEKACEWKRVAAGNEIVAHLDESRRLVLLVEGRARAVMYGASGTVVAFGEVLPGSLTGEITAIDGLPRILGIEAVETSTVAFLGSDHLLQLIKDVPSFGLAMLVHTAQTVRSLTERVIEFSTMSVNARVQAELLRLARRHSRQQRGAVSIPDVPTHAEFAARVSTHREAVTREINRLIKAGVLARSDVGLTIVDIDALRAMVQHAGAS